MTRGEQFLLSDTVLKKLRDEMGPDCPILGEYDVNCNYSNHVQVYVIYIFN